MAKISKLTPILYEKNETDFNHNGLGRLKEVVSYRIEEVLNGEFEAFFEYPANGRLADKIDNQMIIKARPNRKDEPTLFRIYEYDLDIMTGNYVIYARHKNMDDLGSNMILDVAIRGQTPNEAWNLAQSKALEPVRTEFYSDMTTTSSTDWTRRSLLNCVAGEEGSMIQYWGGEIKHGTNRLWLYRRRGQDNVTTVRHGKNLDGLNATYSTKGLVTAVVPYHTFRVEDSDNEKTIYGDVVESQYINHYPHKYYDTVEYSEDDLGLDNEATEAQRTERLNKVTERWFTENTGVDLPSINMEIDLVDLSQTKEYEKFKDFEQIEIGDTITVYSKKYNINVNAKVRRVVYNGLTDMNEEIEVGTVSRSIYDDYKDFVDNRVQEVREQVDAVRASANGKNVNIYGTVDPNEANITGQNGDNYFRQNGQEDEIWIFRDGMWHKVMDSADTTKNARAIEEQQKEIESAQARADEAVEEIDIAVESAGFTSLDETISSVQSIGNSAQANAQTALTQSLDALGDASLAITNAQTAIDTADGALSAANNAKSIADDASSTANTAFQNANSAIATAEDVRNVANNLSTQVSGFETSLDGFNQTINDYEGQVSAFRNDVQGYQSTVASYETEVDEFGNTVSTYATEVSRLENTVQGFESTVVGYRTQVLGYSEDVTRYENQVSTLTNTVNGFENTVAQYTTEVDQYGNEVNRYATEVSTLSNTVDGFNSTVSQVQTDFNNLEIGGRNLIQNSEIRLSPVGEGYEYFGNVFEETGVHTLSFEYEVNEENSPFNVFYIHNSKTGGIVSVSRKEGRLSTTFEVEPEDIGGDLYLYGGNGYGQSIENDVTFLRVQLEKGSIPSDWTPAPEDMATASQVSTLSNTVDGLNNTVARYEVELDEYGNIVNQYATQVSQFENTVSGLSSNVATYEQTVSSYTAQVSSLENTVNGFNSTVQRVEADYGMLSGTVNTHTTELSNMDGRISAKAEQSTVDTLAGTVSSLGTDIGVVAGQINSKVWNTDIESAIEDIEVGGRNLLVGSKETLLNISPRQVAHNGNIYYTYGYSWNFSFNVDFQAGQEYTVSVPIYNPHDRETSARLYVENFGNTQMGLSPGDEKIFSFTFSSEVDTKDTIIRFLTRSGGDPKVAWGYPKLEKGTIATDWTPAPEDTLARFDHIETEWEQTFDTFSQTVAGIDGRVTQHQQTIDTITTTLQEVESDIDSNTTKINQTVDTVTTHTQTIATLQTGLNGKVEISEYNQTVSTVNNTVQRIGNAEGQITQIEANINGLQTSVAGKVGRAEFTQLETGFNSLVTDFNNIEVGGRNLVENSQREWVEVTNQTVWHEWVTDIMRVKPDTTYTYSIEWNKGRYNQRLQVRLFSEGQIYLYDIYDTPLLFSIEQNGRHSYTFTVPDGVYYAQLGFRIERGGVSNDYRYRQPQLEKGNVATDWSPAPEDMATQTQISQLSDNINLRVAKNDVINQINISTEGILLDADKVHIGSSTTIDNGIITNRMVAANAEIDGAKIRDASISTAKIINLDVHSISGLTSNFVQSEWNSAIGGSVRATGNGLISTAPDSSQVVIAGGHLLARQPNGATIGSVGYVNDGTKSPNFTIETSWGTHFNIKQNFLDTWTGYTQEKDVLRVSTYDDGDSEVLWRTNRFQLLGGASLGFAWRHYINGASQRLNITGEESIGLRANESTIFAVSNNGNTNHASLFANLNMNGSNVTNQSDARLKTDISTRQESSLEKINRFNFVDFTWIKDDKSDFGVIAQQVQQVVPELILEGSDGYLNLNNSLMNMMTSHGLQELSQKHDTVAQTVDSHTDTIHRLQQELSQANRRIEELERKIS